ncbi:SDR family oxidoreductase [Leptolyngbya sp. FACHB-261]|uniref:SDR family oxidoreductase n=1 Tax=Leptolyngbya sp. FACHB-261 TaxID=2692806 RepID=UPI0016823011|nr:SDR family oxidoreductase [Leptolyngbya sp. FACHB-261]MBD2104106.1 SDR family oxidoreductase [Leptolyngbya sp. FACHB-261]
MKLAGKVALVTGGGSGIGLATAKLFRQEGAKVVISGRDRNTLNEAALAIGGDVLALQADVVDLRQIEQLYSEITKEFGKIDVLFANAGIAKFATLEAMTETVYDQLFNINVKGLYFTVQKAASHLNDNAAIVLNTSFLGEIGIPGTSALSASKAAVRSMVRTFSAELVSRGIRVNAVSPGAITTPIYGKLDMPQEAVEALAENIVDQVPMKRFGTSEEIAKAVLFLSTSDSTYVLGTEIAVDGGISQL